MSQSQVEIGGSDSNAGAEEITSPVQAETTVVIAEASTKVDFRTRLTALLATIKTKAEDHALVIFLVAVVLALSIFVILFPRLALGSLGAVAAVSGWIAYFDLKKKNKI